MRSRTSRGVPEWSGGKELYIGSAISVIGTSFGVTGIVPGPPEGSWGSTGWGHMGCRGVRLGLYGPRAPAPRGPCAKRSRKEESFSVSITRRHGPRRLAHMPWASVSGPGPDGRVPDLRKTSFITLASSNLKCVDPTGSGDM